MTARGAVKPMRIALSIDGGLASFPGLRRPQTVDCAALPPARADRLRTLIEEARFFSAPVPPASSGPDLRSYTLEIDDGAQSRTLTVGEPIADAGLRALLAEIRACVKEQGGRA